MMQSAPPSVADVPRAAVTPLCRVGPGFAASTLALTTALLREHRERVTGGKECRAAAAHIAALLRRHCDSVYEEEFVLHPGSLWNVGRVFAVAYGLAMLLLLAGGWLVPVALAVLTLVLVYAATHYVFCGKWFDGLFPAAEGCNVAGVIEPAGEVHRQVLVVGHHDSPYVLSFLVHAQRLARFRLSAAMLSYLYLVLLSAAWSLSLVVGRPPGPLGDGYLMLALLGLCFVAPVFFVIGRTPSPGAGDNLNASVIAVRMAELFAARRRDGRPLRHTRLVLLSTDGEEAGQRGAIAYAERHLADLREVPASVLNVDSVYRLKDLAVVTRDRHGTRPLSSEMVRQCRDLAGRLGYPLAALALPLGGGGTDAAAFASLGVPATTIVGIPTSLSGGDHVYHTPLDTAERIEPAAVEAVCDIVANYVLERDGVS